MEVSWRTLMTIDALGYFGINSDRLDDWADFGTRHLGFEIVDRTRDQIRFRMDDRTQRVIVRRGEADTGLMGWELADAAALERLGAHLEGSRVRCMAIATSEADQRGIAAGFRFRDPLGNVLEAFHGPETAATPFEAGRSISGFRTGPLGVGHIVYQMPRVRELRDFYQGVLGFGLSDYFDQPFHASFLHINARHHSLALAEARKPGIHHFMIELGMLDDVGQGYDLARAVPGMVATSLGRHINDLMTSYYARSPDGFFIEYGWGGRSIDPATWQPFELTYGPSLWGHDRDWLSPEALDEAKALRARAAADGLRQPVQVTDGNYRLSPSPCAWWEGAKPRSPTPSSDHRLARPPEEEAIVLP